MDILRLPQNTCGKICQQHTYGCGFLLCTAWFSPTTMSAIVV